MISRLSAFATAFAVAVTTVLAVTAQAHAPAPVRATPAAVKTVRIIELPRVVVVARRLDRSGQ